LKVRDQSQFLTIASSQQETTMSRKSPGELQRRASPDCSDCATRPYCVLGKGDTEARHALQPLIRKRSFQRGEVLSQEGSTTDTAFVVKLGTVFGYRQGLDGQSRPVGIAGRGSTFGFFSVFGQPNQATAVAASSGRLCEIPVAALLGASKLDGTFSGDIAGAAVQTCARVATWAEGMRMRGVVNQLGYALLVMAETQHQNVIELPTHVALADLLGTTRETVARGLASLEAEGCLVRGERKKCEVRREALLARLGAPDADRQAA
jgi:CRP-like cAMP-binding protein